MHHPGPAHLPADQVGHLLDQVRAPPGRQTGAGREHHVAAGQEAAERLGVEEHRNAEPAPAHHLVLDGADHRGQLGRVVVDQLGDVARRVAKYVLCSGRVRAVRIDHRPRHPGGQLVTLLGDGHLRQQQVGPVSRARVRDRARSPRWSWWSWSCVVLDAPFVVPVEEGAFSVEPEGKPDVVGDRGVDLGELGPRSVVMTALGTEPLGVHGDRRVTGRGVARQPPVG